jgi:hypothetical protein
MSSQWARLGSRRRTSGRSKPDEIPNVGFKRRNKGVSGYKPHRERRENAADRGGDGAEYEEEPSTAPRTERASASTRQARTVQGSCHGGSRSSFHLSAISEASPGWPDPRAGQVADVDIGASSKTNEANPFRQSPSRNLLAVARATSRLRLLGITDVGQKRHLTRAFDRDRDLVLVFSAGARVPAASDLAPLGDEAAELRDVL